jgi:hypothetical protein
VPCTAQYGNVKSEGQILLTKNIIIPVIKH